MESSQGSLQKETDESEKDDKIKELERLVEDLRKQIKKVKQTSKRRKVKANSVSEDNKMLRDQLDELYSVQDVTDILVKVGGLSRATLFSKEFHHKYPGAAKCLWGFDSYEETLVMVKCLFEDVNIDDIPTLRSNKKRKATNNDVMLDLPRITKPLEKCLICRMFFRNDLSHEFIALIFGRHRTTIGSILKEWAPRWGKAGEQLSILDITDKYLEEEEPDRSEIVGVTKTVNVDGTDTTIEKSRKDPTEAALEYGSKNKVHGARSLNWCSSTCLAFEHTKQFGARASEKAIYELHGALGKRKAPLHEWKDIGRRLSKKQKICKETKDMHTYHRHRRYV